MSTDQERLVVALEARIRDFEKNMLKASRTASRNLDSIEKRTKTFGDRLEKTMASASARFGGIMRTFGAGFVGGIAAGGLAGIISQVGDVAEGVANIGSNAKRAGIAVRDFQELAYVAKVNRIEVDALVDGVKELNLRADEFIVTGKGPAAEAFARLGYRSDELKHKLANPSALLVEIIDRLGKMDRAAQIRISDELFGGTAGERFVELLDQGADAIRDTIREANELGIVLDSDVIAKAEEVDRKFKIVAATVGTTLKRAIVEAASALAGFIDSFRAFEDQHNRTLDNRLTEIGGERLKLENEILAVRQKQDAITGVLAQAERRQLDGTIATLERRRDELATEEARILEILNSRTTPKPTSGTAQSWTPPAITPPSGGDRRSRAPSRDRAAEAALREQEAVRLLINELEEELRLVGASDQARRAAEASRRAGSAATAEQRQQIVALNEVIYSERAALEAANDNMREIADTGREFVGGFVQDLRNGVAPVEALGNAIGRLSDRIFNELLDSIFAVQGAGNGSGGILGGVFGWIGRLLGFRDGGIVQPRRLASGGMVRGAGTSTSDSIPAMLSDGEFVVKASATKKHRRLLEAVNDGALNSLNRMKPPTSDTFATGNVVQHVTISAPVTVNGSGGTPTQNEDLARRTARQMEAAMRGIVVDEMRKAMRPGNLNRSRGT